jgi:hypothetical protein
VISFSDDFCGSTGIPVGRFGFLAWDDVGESLLILLSLKSSAQSSPSLLHLSHFGGLLSDLTCFCQCSVLLAHSYLYQLMIINSPYFNLLLIFYLFVFLSP